MKKHYKYLAALILTFLSACGGSGGSGKFDPNTNVSGSFTCTSGCPGECGIDGSLNVSHTGDSLSIDLPSFSTFSGTINTQGQFEVSNSTGSCNGHFDGNRLIADCNGQGTDCGEVVFESDTPIVAEDSPSNSSSSNNRVQYTYNYSNDVIDLGVSSDGAQWFRGEFTSETRIMPDDRYYTSLQFKGLKRGYIFEAHFQGISPDFADEEFSDRFDALLTLIPNDKLELQINDDDSGELNAAYINQALPEDGDYLLLLRSYEPGDTGSWNLGVSIRPANQPGHFIHDPSTADDSSSSSSSNSCTRSCGSCERLDYSSCSCHRRIDAMTISGC